MTTGNATNNSDLVMGALVNEQVADGPSFREQEDEIRRLHNKIQSLDKKVQTYYSLYSQELTRAEAYRDALRKVYYNRGVPGIALDDYLYDVIHGVEAYGLKRP